MQSYAAHPPVRKVEALLPAHARGDGTLPVERVETVGSFDVHIDEWQAREPRGRLILFHGGGGHGRLLAPYARMAVRAGVTAIAPDLPGFGLTRIPDKGRIRYTDWREVAAEILTREVASGLPVFVFGLSMGGLLAYEAVCATGVAAGLMATCFLDPTRAEMQREIARFPWLAPLSLPVMNATAPLTDDLILPMAWLAKMGAIANDREVARAIAADPRAGGNAMPLGFLRTYLRSRPLRSPDAFDLCPVLLAHPADDRWTRAALSLPFFEALAAPKRLVMLDNAGHFPIEQPGFDQLESAMGEMFDRAGLAGAAA